MTVTIVIPAHNAARTLRQCLESCLHQTYPGCFVVVVDDGSTDATPAIAESLSVRVVRQQKRGPAAARNAGAAVATSDIVVFTDADCVPHADWVEKLLSGFSAGIGAVGGTYGIANPKRLLARMIHEEIQLRHARFGDSVDFLGSFNLAVRRELFEKLGGFDESFSAASGEDNDLSYRILDAGQKLGFVRAAIVEHYHPVVPLAYLRTQARHGFWRVKLYTKHPKRGGGDRYAGIIDMAAPACVLLLIWAIAYTGTTAGAVWIRLACALLGTVVVIDRLALAARMMFHGGSAALALFFPVLLLRDLARGFGMLHGMWTFLIRRKVTA